MPSKILVEQIAHTNETSALDIDSSGNMVLQKELKFGGTGAIKNSAGNAILQESGGNVTISNVRLPASGGISDSSGNAIITESGGNVSIANAGLRQVDYSTNSSTAYSSGEPVVITQGSYPTGSLVIHDNVNNGGWQILPIGTVISVAYQSAPRGFLKCNGAAISRTTYAGLFAYLGTAYGVGDGSTTFNVPDLRGEFIRGWDDSRGVDAGRAIAQSQTDDFKSHTHTFTFRNTYSASAGGQARDSIRHSNPQYPATSATGGTETRPRNIALNYIIKY